MKKFGFMLLALVPLLLGAASLSLELQLPVPSALDVQSLRAEAYGVISQAGRPQLPCKTVNVLLPKGASLRTHSLSFGGERFVAAPAPAVNPGFSDGDNLLSSPPQELSEQRIVFLGMKKWGELNYASFRILPAVQVPGGYLWSTKLVLNLEYAAAAREKGRIPGTFKDSSYFANPGALSSWYERSVTRDYDYLIVTNSTLYPALSGLVNFRSSQGMQVSFADIATILQSSPGASPSEKLFNYLVSEYNAHPFTYLLLVGDIDVVPIAMLTPEPDGYETVPSDFYYSDLSSLWDTDNDGRLGEYYLAEGSQDWMVDYTPEVFVGRIASNDPQTVQDVANRTVTFENSPGAWKNKALLPAAFLNYGGEPEPIYLQTDGAGLMELMDETILSDMETTTMYEQEGYVPSYPSDYPLNSTTLKNLFSSQSWGLVNWSAHGSATSSSRKVWMNDNNGNNLPDSYEMDWMGLVSKQSFDNLVNTDGMVIFAASCYNGMIDGNEASLGEYSLAKKSVATVAATRTGWYKIGWQNPGWGGLSSYNYHWIENYHRNQMSVGMASAYANLLHTQIYLFGDPVDAGGIIWPELQNVYTYLLYGDPAVGYQPQQEAPAASILIWEPIHHHGLRLQNAISAAGNYNVVYSNRIIPDYQYLDQFEAVFCLFGYGDTAYILAPGSIEYNALNAYLNAGGSVWLEGWINWDDTDPLMNKFGIIAPFDHIAVIESIRQLPESENLVWAYDDEGMTSAQALTTSTGSTAVPVFRSENLSHVNDIIGIFNTNGSYRTLGSSFRSTDVMDSTLTLVDLVSRVLTLLDVPSGPVSNDDELAPPNTLQLKAWPNPFNRALHLETNLKAEESAELSIYNLKGQRVFKAGIRGPGYTLDPSETAALGSGVYLVKLQTGSSLVTKRVLLVR